MNFTIKQHARLLRIKAVKLVVKLLLPSDIWVGNTVGVYTRKMSVHLGKLDSRGVLQGVEDRKA